MHRGALVYALRPASTVKSSLYPGSTDPNIRVHDVQVHPNATWNYALLPSSLRFVGGGEVPSPFPFDADKAPAVKVVAQARMVSSWHNGGGARGVAPPPRSPLHSSAPLETIELVPYGATNIRISVFPQLCDPSKHDQPPCYQPPQLPPNAVDGLNLPNGDIIKGPCLYVGVKSRVSVPCS